MCVALLAEGVDRNNKFKGVFIRRVCVALLAEGVDRNSKDKAGFDPTISRPPRGGRG